MALSSKNAVGISGRRRFLRSAGHTAVGLSASLALPRMAVAQMQTPTPTASATTPLPRMSQRLIPATGERLPVVGCGTWRTFDVGDDPAGRAQLADVLRFFSKPVVQ